MISESYAEKIARVQQMAAGDGTWDLSMNDVAALKSLLSKIEEQERELVRLREGWVSVKDRLPDENVEVLCCRPDEEAWIDYWETFADGPEWSADCETRIPTHWMPLPAPPVMEKQGVVDVPKVK